MYRHIPNILTSLRLIAAPVIALLLLGMSGPIAAWAALLIFIVAAVTDWLDGFLARRWQSVSNFGRMLDPIADKLMVIVLLVALMGTELGGMGLLVPAVVIVTREILVSGLREFMGKYDVIVAVTMAAKFKTTFQLIALGFLLASFAFAKGTPLYQLAYQGGFTLIWLAAALTAWTGVSYFTQALAQIPRA